MLLLGLDTATPAVTVALHDGGQPLAQLVTVDAHRHAELLAPAIAKAVADAGVTQRDLTAIVAGVGPGPYTGLRVGLVTARVLGAALDIPVYGLCSLDIIAADTAAGGDSGTAGPGGDFLVTTDARRRELYWARYDAAGRRTAGPDVARPADIPVSGLPAAGEGPMLYPELLPDSLGPAYPAAATLCRIAVAALTAGDPGHLLLPPEPLYLRRPDAREPGARKRVTRVTTQTPQLRPLRAADLVDVLALEHELFPDDPWTPEMFADEVAQPPETRLYLLAEAAAGDGGVDQRQVVTGRGAASGLAMAGYAGLMFVPGGVQADVLTIAVRSAYWGQGIGSALLAALLGAARERGCTEVLLEVRADNPRAQGLYQRRGFEEIGIRRGYYQPSGVDAVVMRKDLLQ